MKPSTVYFECLKYGRSDDPQERRKQEDIIRQDPGWTYNYCYSIIKDRPELESRGLFENVILRDPEFIYKYSKNVLFNPFSQSKLPRLREAFIRGHNWCLLYLLEHKEKIPEDIKGIFLSILMGSKDPYILCRLGQFSEIVLPKDTEEIIKGDQESLYLYLYHKSRLGIRLEYMESSLTGHHLLRYKKYILMESVEDYTDPADVLFEE